MRHKSLISLGLDVRLGHSLRAVIVGKRYEWAGWHMDLLTHLEHTLGCYLTLIVLQVHLSWEAHGVLGRTRYYTTLAFGVDSAALGAYADLFTCSRNYGIRQGY
jgi:hypothetical protein